MKMITPGEAPQPSSDIESIRQNLMHTFAKGYGHTENYRQALVVLNFPGMWVAVKNVVDHSRPMTVDALLRQSGANFEMDSQKRKTRIKLLPGYRSYCRS